MNHAELERIARGMVAPGKGLLAADESTGTIKKRFDAIAFESTEANRQLYREMLLAAPGINEAISGVILYDETLRQKTRAGVPFPQHLESLGIFPGIKVDQGAKPLANFPNETVTEDHGLGARFAKWRAVIDIGAGYPTRFCIEANAHALARYAALCQEQGIVPIVEPEVLMDGAHSLETCEAVTDEVLCETFRALAAHRVHLEGIVLKPNMVISGKKNAARATPEQVAEATVRCLRRWVSPAVPGIAFLSGGQSTTEATLHLSLMNRQPLPWALTFSYGRALQNSALNAWGGKPANFEAGQREFMRRARLNGLAAKGGYTADMESGAA